MPLCLRVSEIANRNNPKNIKAYMMNWMEFPGEI